LVDFQVKIPFSSFSCRIQAAARKDASTADVANLIKQYDRTARMCGYRGKLWVENGVDNAEIDVNTQIMAMALTSWGIDVTTSALVKLHTSQPRRK
jgi:hypothetical protein